MRGLSRVPAYHSGLSGIEEAGMAAKKASRMGQAIRKHALSFPETGEEFPWGESAFKVKGKTFVFMPDPGYEAFVPNYEPAPVRKVPIAPR